MTIPEYVKRMDEKYGVNCYFGYKPKSGIKSVKESFTPVNKILGGKLLLYPDPDACNVETSSNEDVYTAVSDILDVFDGTKGTCVCFSTWSPEKSVWGMKACEDYREKLRRM